MAGECLDLRILLGQLLVKCLGEHGIRQFGLLIPDEVGGPEPLSVPSQIPPPLLKKAGFQLLRPLPCPTRVIHHPRLSMDLCTFLQTGQKKRSKEEVAEVVRLHLHVVAVLCRNVFVPHHTRIVCEAVQVGVLCLHRLPGFADGGEVLEIAVDCFEGAGGDRLFKRREGLLCPLGGPVQKQNRTALLGHRAGSHKARAGSGACDGEDLPINARKFFLEVLKPTGLRVGHAGTHLVRGN
mmetsp:Transcript_9948/g.19299  ORF Transcript_9948/g.19299 Transcript_9948/m.19299 type:complete len:238 (-) Transcript_9948:187-900(-)